MGTNNERNVKKYKLPLIIVGGIILLIIIIFLISKLFNKDKIVYEEKLYYINLIGSTNITMYQGDIFIEPGYKGTDDEGNDLTQEVAVSTNINSDKIGNYKVSYTLGNVTKERNVKVIDKPMGATYIHLYGDVNVFLYVGEKYDEKGYEVIDTVDGNSLKDKVIVNSNVNTEKEGIYKVIYSVTNTSGITTSKVRTVIVMDRNLSLIPSPNEVTNGNVTINIYARDELFYYLILPNNMKETKSVSTYEVSNNGTYKFIMYNNKGESREKSIEITNIDREVPSGSCSGYYGSGISQITINAKDNVGISKYEIDGTSYTSSSIKLNKEVSSVNITIYDKAGNTKAISCKLEDKRPTPSSAKPSFSNNPSSSKPAPSSNEIKSLNVPAGTTERTDYDDEMRYIEIMPDNATTNMPLVIYLDGAYSHNNFSSKILDRATTKYVQSGDAYNETGESFIFVAPRYVITDGVSGGLNWFGSNGPREAKKIAGLIEHLCKKYQINRKRIYITGVSLGGDGTFYMINAYPNLFAAATAVSGCPFTCDPNNFVTTPIIGYNGTGEVEKSAGYTNCVPSMIKKIQNAGGIAESRVKKGFDHVNMIKIYSTDKDVFKWMFKYHK